MLSHWCDDHGTNKPCDRLTVIKMNAYLEFEQSTHALSGGMTRIKMHVNLVIKIKAWADLCGDDSPDLTLIIRADMPFLLISVSVNDPCKSSIVHIQLLGNITAPKTGDGWKYCNQLPAEDYVKVNLLKWFLSWGMGLLAWDKAACGLK
ncbi:pectin lyase-like superfamily protein [Artemisia annua]|uniref:Pectin lyase-like superfamily protein n=1 Tax=Artemisia annua TaxID=35608 RepID=A0A2U1MKG1_ARTAN|nr:pectin lyase-like superfamily protein [Artemisia annua]